MTAELGMEAQKTYRTCSIPAKLNLQNQWGKYSTNRGNEFWLITLTGSNSAIF
jgi:hypothetical protein